MYACVGMNATVNVSISLNTDVNIKMNIVTSVSFNTYTNFSVSMINRATLTATSIVFPALVLI